MGRLMVKLDYELERKFREAAFRKYGFKKGSLQKALIEAIEKWLKEEEG